MKHEHEKNDAGKNGSDKISPAISSYTPEEQSKLTMLLDEYLTQLENGERPNETALIESNPEIADLLKVQLDNLRMLHHAADTPAGSGMAHYTAPKQLGDYALRREIGRGGMGIVYEAVDQTLNRQVALKVLPFAAVLDRKQIARFRNEAQAAAQLNHANIVPVYSVGVDRGVHFYAMQFVEGRPLSDAIDDLRGRKHLHLDKTTPYGPKQPVDPSGTELERPDSNRTRLWSPPKIRSSVFGLDSDDSRHDVLREDTDAKGDGKIEPGDAAIQPKHSMASTARLGAISTYEYPVGTDFFKHAARLAIQVADGLQHAHDFGVVHRDVKPSNLLLDDAGKIWIADFGLAHIPNDVSMTATGDVLGTVRYMSPEQASGRGAFVDHRTDIYSLGLTLYELVTFEPAFSSNRRARLLEQQSTEPTTPRKINRAIPVDLETIINKAISKEASDRYASASAMSDDLRRFVEGRPTLARPPSMADRIAKWSHRHRRAVTAAALALVLATCGSAIATIKLSAERDRTAAERNRTALALTESQENLEQSQINLKAARAMVDRLGVRVAKDLAWVPGTESIRRELLMETQKYYEFFLTQSDDESLRGDRAIAMTNAGGIADQLGQKDQALKLYADARTSLQSLIDESPDELRFHREHVRSLNNEAVLLRRMGRTEEALDRLQAALQQHQNLAVKFGRLELIDDLASAQANRAEILKDRGNMLDSRFAFELAIGSLRAALEQSPQDFERAKRLSICLNNLASITAFEDPEAALQSCEEAISIQQRLIELHPGRIPMRSDLAISYDSLGRLQDILGHGDRAQRSYERAIAIEQRLTELAPSNVKYRTAYAISLNHLGQLHVGRSHFESAHAVFKQSARILETLVELAPGNVTYVSDLGAVKFNQGLALAAMKRIEDGKKICLQGLKYQEQAVQQAPREPHFKQILVTQTQEFERMFAEAKPN